MLTVIDEFTTRCMAACRHAMRWKIEVYHKILKSGCRAEQARLGIAERLVRLLAVFCDPELARVLA